MLTLLRRIMNGIITALDNMSCSIGCCTNAINVQVPQICAECSRKTISSTSSSYLFDKSVSNDG